MARSIEVGMPVEIIPGITPDIFGGGGILTRDEYGIKGYQTNIANIEKIGDSDNPNLPTGTVLVRHGQDFSIYSINHIREYNPDNNSNNDSNDPSMNNSSNIYNRNNNPTELDGGRRKKHSKKTRKYRVKFSKKLSVSRKN